jgi:hypothetical protein
MTINLDSGDIRQPQLSAEVPPTKRDRHKLPFVRNSHLWQVAAVVAPVVNNVGL